MRIRDLFRIRHQITYLLLKRVFALYLLLAVAVTGLHMVLEYSNADEWVKRDLSVMEGIIQDSLEAEVWQLDKKSVSNLLNGVLKSPSVVGIRLEEVGEEAVKLGLIYEHQEWVEYDSLGHSKPITSQSLHARVITHQFNLTYVEPDESTRLGRVVLYSSSSAVLDKVRQNFLLILINALLKTAFLWLVFMWVGNRLLSGPFARLNEFSSNLNLTTLPNCNLDLQTEENCELKTVENSLNAMIRQLKASVAELMHTKSELELKSQQLEVTNQSLHENNQLLKATERQLMTVNELAKIIHQMRDPDQMLQRILSTFCELLPAAQRAFCMQLDPTQHRYLIRQTYHLSEDEFISLSVSPEWRERFYANFTHDEGEVAITTGQGIANWELYRSGKEPATVLSVMVTLWGELVAVLHFYNMDDQQAFPESLLTAVAELSIHIVDAFNRNRMLEALQASEALQQKKAQEMETLSNKLSRYLSPQVFNSIFTGQREVRREAYRKRLCLFVAKAIGFTELTEHIDSELLSESLNYYFNEIALIAQKHGGTIDQLSGETVVIFFGDPATLGPEEDAVACASMALEIKKQLPTMQERWYNMGIPQPLRLGMSVHSGYCTVGNFGAENLLNYTILGNQVNIAKLIVKQSQPNEILVSEDTLQFVEPHFRLESAGTIQLADVDYQLQLYRILEISTEKIQLLQDIKGVEFEMQERNWNPQAAEDMVDRLEQLLEQMEKRRDELLQTL